MHKYGTERLKTLVPLHLKFIRKRKETFAEICPPRTLNQMVEKY